MVFHSDHLSSLDITSKSKEFIVLGGQFSEGKVVNFQKELIAYDQLLQILVVTDADQSQYDALRDYYISWMEIISNQDILTYVAHLMDMCFVNGNRVENAIASFENIITNNPNTERALFAQVDLYTAALLDTTQALGKGFSKVTLSNYRDKISQLFNRTGKVAVSNILPSEYNLFQNYPNPFNPSTTIQYDVPKTSRVTLTIYDVLGREVTTLVNEVKEQGRYTAQFNASSLSSGMYVYRITAGKFVAAKKMMLVK